MSAYLDVADMAESVIRLLQRDDERQRMGQVAAARVRKEHTVEQAGPVLVDVIRGAVDCCTAPRPSSSGRYGETALLQPSLHGEKVAAQRCP